MGKKNRVDSVGKSKIVIEDDEYWVMETELSVEAEEENIMPSVSGKKKGNKQQPIRINDDKKEDDDVENGDDDDHQVTRKSKKDVNYFVSSAFALLGDDGDLEESKQQSENEDDDEAVIVFTGKKKPSKKKKCNKITALVDEPSTIVTSKEVDVPKPSKNKKKKKKGGERTDQDNDDIGKILGDVGEEPPPSIAFERQNEPAVNKGGGNDAVEDVVESAAAKKKRKKKEKENEKKASASAAVVVVEEEKTVEESSKTVVGKKVPKHVKEMQERLAKIKEAEEKRKREEEEKLKKEEEELLMQEELERIAQEKKRLKKEREKEKRLKKKQEGKLLTPKQKADAQRREQFLAANFGIVPTIEGAPTKPKYVTRKSKPRQQAPSSLTEEEDIISDKEDLVDMENVSPLELEENVNKEEEEDDDDDWDAKSWDDTNLNLPGVTAFSEEEETEPIVKKEIKSVPNNQNQRATVVFANNKAKQDVKGKKKEKQKEEESGGEKTLRSPICCIMGHVDTGKTKLLDCIRRTNVQEGEAGGITQQIGATYIPSVNIRERTEELKPDAKLNVPGLLVIDTPGHESFKNLRSRGSGLCDIAILVVDIMHRLEPQTIESLNLLRMRNTDFIIALNKVDRLYGWKTCRNAPIGKAMKLQTREVQIEFGRRVTQIITEFKEQGLNTELYSKNKDMGDTYSLVPTSAISGEGIPEMLLLLVQWAQKTMIEKLTLSSDIQCTVLEVKVIEGLGTTIDVVLVNGVLHQGDEIVVCGFQGPIHTTIRSLLTPHPMKELRVKGAYIHHKEIKAAQGIKITAQSLEHAVAGTALYVVGRDDDVEDIKESVMDDMRNVMSRIDKSGEGVYVQASTLGSLEALLEFLKTPAVNIPVSGIGIGPVHKKDVVKASVMLEKRKEFATILAFDVKVNPEARELAEALPVKIFEADIIYHLFDQFKAYIDNLKEEKKKEAAEDAVFPCVLQIMPNCVFNKKDPIIVGVDVLKGILKIGTPLCIPQKNFIDIGRVSSIKRNSNQLAFAKKGQQVAIKITGSNPEEKQKMFGRHFEMADELVSHISRKSLDILKTNYKDEISNEERKLIIKLKRIFRIP